MASKSDFPSLRMRVEGGRLVPASAFDQDRISSYRNGSVVMVRVTEEKDRVLIKKWWAIIGLVMKQCATPWKTKDEAHEAIKLALGIVNLSKTVTGKWMQYPKSLSDLDDPEMTEAFENMIALLSRMTGVDVSTLKKETAHVGAGDEKQPETTVESAERNSASCVPQETQIAPDGANSGKEAVLTGQERKFLAEFANKALFTAKNDAIDHDARAGILLNSELDWREACANHLWPYLGQIAKGAIAISSGKRTAEQYVQHFGKTLGVAAETIE